MSGLGMAQKSIDLIDHSYRILAAMHPATVRGVAYQLFTRDLIENMGDKCVRNVSRMIVIAREKGIIPWEWIVDETRQEERVSSWNGLGDFGETVVRGYRKDFWQHQDSWIKVFSEKATVGGIVRPILDEFAVGFQVLHGFGSATSLHDVAEESLTGERYLEILYIGDFDPSGMHMSEVDLPGRVEKYGGVVDITRIALTWADCTDALSPFSVETKSRDPRYAWFKRNYGARCWELDAMNPNDLRRRLRNEITRRFDLDAWAHCQTTEAAERESLNAYVNAWPRP
ncbi:MAG TPA: hypothetical protein VGP28_03795 [Methylocella sp.]|jgi:hypothetical protein|nr:hypothetical protein [Methylocella sp.]